VSGRSGGTPTVGTGAVGSGFAAGWASSVKAASAAKQISVFIVSPSQKEVSAARKRAPLRQVTKNPSVVDANHPSATPLQLVLPLAMDSGRMYRLPETPVISVELLELFPVTIPLVKVAFTAVNAPTTAATPGVFTPPSPMNCDELLITVAPAIL
jgi:hypothetical protein